MFCCGTEINGVKAEWTDEIKEKWESHKPEFTKHEAVTACNYFGPQPWRNEYDRGSIGEGFTFTVNHRDVCQVRFDGEQTLIPFQVYEQRRPA